MKKTDICLYLVICLFCVSCNSEMDPDPLTSEYVESYQSLWDCQNIDRPEDSYNYPTYPGTKKWASLGSGEEMVKACQVPVKTLKNMSTQAVVQALWEYPLLIEILNRFTYQRDFEFHFSDNNAYRELLKRKDAGACVMQRLLLVDPLISTRGKQTMHAFEVFMSQPELLSQLNENEKKTLIKTIMEKEDELGTFTFTKISTCWLFFAQTMISSGDVPFLELVNSNAELNAFFNEKNHLIVWSSDVNQLIYKHCIQFINN